MQTSTWLPWPFHKSPHTSANLTISPFPHSWTLPCISLPLAAFNLYPFTLKKDKTKQKSCNHKYSAFLISASCSSKLSNLRVVLGTPWICSQLIWSDSGSGDPSTCSWSEVSGVRAVLWGCSRRRYILVSSLANGIGSPGQTWQSEGLCPQPCGLMDSGHLWSEEWGGAQAEKKTCSIWESYNKDREHRGVLYSP